MKRTRIGTHLYFYTNPAQGVDFGFTVERPKSGTAARLYLKDGFSNANAESWVIERAQAKTERDLASVVEAMKHKAQYLGYDRVCLPFWAKRNSWVDDALQARGFQKISRECGLGWATKGGIRRERERLEERQEATGRKLVPTFSGVKTPRGGVKAAEALQQALQRQHAAYVAKTILQRQSPPMPVAPGPFFLR